MSPGLGFQADFADAVEAGAILANGDRDRATVFPTDEDLRRWTDSGVILRGRKVRPKRQTIRALRVDGRDPKPGDTLYLWTGLRQPGARKLGEVICRSVTRIEIDDGGLVWLHGADRYLCGTLESDEIAQRDGFLYVETMVDWFREAHGLPFEGLLIRW